MGKLQMNSFYFVWVQFLLPERKLTSIYFTCILNLSCLILKYNTYYQQYNFLCIISFWKNQSTLLLEIVLIFNFSSVHYPNSVVLESSAKPSLGCQLGWRFKNHWLRTITTRRIVIIGASIGFPSDLRFSESFISCVLIDCVDNIYEYWYFC